MKIKLKTLMSGPGGTYQPGEELDLEPKAAKPLIAGGFAEEIKQSRKAETANLFAPENAAKVPTAEETARATLKKIAEAEAQAEKEIPPTTEQSNQNDDQQ